MNKYFITLAISVLFLLSIVHGQDHRDGKLLSTQSDAFQCNSEGFHPDPNDCSVFYRCIEWGESSENSLQSRFTYFKFQCGEETIFDTDSNSCIHIDESTRTECRQFYEPNEFARISQRDAPAVDYGVLQSPSGYNPPSQQPSYGNRPGTNAQEPSDSSDDNNIGDSSKPPSKSPPCEADGFFPIENDCSHFYRCVSSGSGFIKYEFSCGPGTVWDSDNNACNHRWAVQRSDCREEIGSEDGNVNEPEIAEQVSEPSSSSAPSTTSTARPYPSPTSRPSSSTSTTTSKPTTTTTTTSKPTTTSTSSTTSVSSTTQSTGDSSSTTPSQNSTGSGSQSQNSCNSEGFFPDEKNCKKFYRCVDQGGKFTKYEFECAEGTVWDIQENTCNYDYAVQQSNCNSSSETQTTTSEESSSEASSSASTSSQSSASTSSASSSSSASTSSYTNSSSTSSSSTSQTSSQTTSSSSQTTSSQSSSSFSSTSSQTTSSSQQTSSSQTSANQSSNSTNSSQNTTTTVASQTASLSNNGSQTKDDKCTEEGFFPSSTNCNKFYRCVKNEGSGFTKYEFNCGPGTVWDPDNNVCNHPWAVSDEKCRTGGPSTSPMSETPSNASTTVSPSTETQPDTSESSDNSTSTTTPSYQTTTTDSSSGTSSSTSSTGSNVTTTDSSSSTDITDSTTTSSNTTTTEISTISTTPETNLTTTDPSCQNSTKPPSKIKCEKAGYYANPDDCKKFYRCVDWDGDKGERFSVYHFNCPEGTIFDPSLNICNHEESVYPPRDCSGNSGSQTTDHPTTQNPSDNSTTSENPTTTDTPTNGTETTDVSSETTTLPTTIETSTNSTNEPTTTSVSETTVPQSTPSITTTEGTTFGPSTGSEKPTNPTTLITTEGSSALTTPASQITTTLVTTTESSTTPAPSENCPELGPGQFSLVCPTGFRRHPQYCNVFYQCTVSKTMDIKIVTLSCANGTVYDEKKIQCLPPEEAKKCESGMMTDARSLKKLNDNSVAPINVKSDKTICPNEGSFSYKDDCRLFYKCQKDDQGKLMGYLYQCPEGFAYWSVSKRCEKTEKVPCENKKTSATTWKSTLAPVESKNVGF